MDPLTDLGVAVAGEVATSTLAKIKKHAAYVYNYKENINALQEARAHLDAKRTDASKFSEDAKTRLREVSSSVNDWKCDADKLHQTSHKLICRNNISCLNLWSRYSSSKHAWMLTQDIDQKVRSAPDFGTSFGRQISEGDKFNLKGYMQFESRLTILDGVLKAMKDDDVRICSICGMGGIGKTTMAKKLVKIVEADCLFEKVAMVTVSQNPNFEKIQNEIIELLGLKIDVSTMSARAKLLNDWLSNSRTLLILDDVWWQFHEEDFDEVGIPLAAKGCKIVITSRKEDECKKMEIKWNFCLKVLDDGEAMELFIQNAGKHVEERNLLETARKIVAECDGLPIAIVTIARALKDKPQGEWDDSLKKLQMSNLLGISDMEKVYSRIQLSYDQLKDSEAQSCLRLCCLFPEDYNVPIEKMVFYGKGLELFDGVDSLKEARDRVDSIVHKLKNSFLLLDGEKDGCVKLHDIVRDFAIWVSSKDENPYLLRYEKEMEKWPENYRYEKCSSISFLCKKIMEHPTDLRCPNLKLLQLRFEYGSGELPIAFFEGMEELRVVDLQVRSQIPPLTMQKALKTLLISNEQYGLYEWGLPEDFRKMRGEGDMKSLEVFSLSSLSLYELPVEIGLMSSLRCLRFLKGSMKYIPPGVLSNLVKLEELELPLNFIDWGLKELGGSRVNASLDEMASLPLTSITIGLQKSSILAENILKSLTRFRISIELYSLHHGSDDIFNVDSNVLHVRNVDACDVVVNWTSHLLRLCHSLIFYRVDLKYIMSQQSTRNNGYHCTFFSRLKTLEIEWMDSLEEIFHGPYLANIQQHPCFSKLTELVIYHCPKLKFVFPLSLAREFIQLQSMRVGDCNHLEEVFYQDRVDDGNQKTDEGIENVGEREVDNLLVFPRLKILRLEFMDQLRVLCNGDHRVECPSLEEVTFEKCDNMEGLSYGSFNAPRTKNIKLKKVGQLKNITWLHSDRDNGIPQLTKLQIVESHEMKYLVDATVDLNLLKVFFANLKELFIDKMDRLEEIWDGPYLSKINAPCFGNLTEISISHCPKLKKLLPLSAATELRELKEMKIMLCEEIEEIFFKDQSDDPNKIALSDKRNVSAIETKTTETLHNPKDEKSEICCPNPTSFIQCFRNKGKQPKSLPSDKVIEENVKKVDEGEVDRATVLPRLKLLHLDGMPKLRVLYNGNNAVECPSLEELNIQNCNNMEGLSNGPFSASKIKFLELKGVRHLKNISSWLHLEPENGIPQLTKLWVFESHEMKHLVDETTEPINLLEMFFSSLKELALIRMDSLIEICHGPCLLNIHAQCFSNLTEIWIEKCPKLKYMFPVSVATELEQLKELQIFSCEEMEQIFYKDQVDDGNQNVEENNAQLNEKEFEYATIVATVIFPQLNFLRLSELPKLRIFYGGNHAIELASLESLIIDKCKEIKALSNGSFEAPKLGQMTIDARTEYLSAGEDVNATVRKMLNIVKDENKDEDEKGDTDKDREEDEYWHEEMKYNVY